MSLRRENVVKRDDTLWSKSKATQWPQWALVGRVGVGKSTLFARLIGDGSLLARLVGPTRDWVEHEVVREGKVIRLADTAGYPDDEDPLRQAAWHRTQGVIRRADRLVLVTDARAGLSQDDEQLVQQVRRAGKPFVVAANKADSIALQHEAASVFSTLGVTVVPVSARQGDGIDQLFRVLTSRHPERSEGSARVSKDVDSRFRGLPKRSTGCFSDEKLAERTKMDSRLRGNDKVGGSASRLAKSAGSEEKHTLSLSFPRRRESTEKASKSGSDEFLEVPFRGNDRVGVASRGEIPAFAGMTERSFVRQDDKESRSAQGDNEKQPPSPKFVVLGRPNAGKSTFLNSLLQQERYVTSPVAGTTLDAVASMWQGKGQLYHLVDTPGLRRRSRVRQPLEQAGGQVVTTALRSSHVALLLIDATQGVTQQDAKIASLVHRRRRGLVLVASKWDRAREQRTSQKTFADALRRDLPFLSYAPLVFVSAWSRASVMRAVRVAQNVCGAYHQRCATSAVNRCLHQAMQDHKPPRVRGRPLKMTFGWQDASGPPVFCLTCNRPAEVPDSYERYLIHRLRDAFGFVGVPITLVFRAKHP